MSVGQSWRFRPWRWSGRSGRSSLWLEQALTLEPDAWERAPRLVGREHADLCVIGGGFTGLWTAIRLSELEPSLKVTLVEAELCGSGASGRNGGMVSDWWVKLPTLVKKLGASDAVRVAETVAAGADELERFCAAEAIDPRLSRNGWFWTATNEAQRATIEAVISTAESAGVAPFALVERDELVGRLGSPLHRFGVFDPRGGALQPALLARGLRRAALARGVAIFERTPVTEIEASTGGVRIRSRSGEIRCSRAVLAANAWMAHLPGLREDTIVVSSDVVATAPAPALLEKLGWRGDEGAFDARMMIDYWRATSDGRIVFGRGGGTHAFSARIGARFEHSPRQQRLVERDLRRLLPDFASMPVTHGWAGAVERTSDGLVRYGRLGGDARLHYAIGLSGSGVVPSVTVGRCLASIALEQDDEWARLAQLFDRAAPALPREPLRYLGGFVVRRAVERKERREDEGRRPSRFDRRLAALAPGGVAVAPRRVG